MSTDRLDTPTPSLEAPKPLPVLEILKLLLRTWPFIRPVVWHVIGWLTLAMVLGVIVGYIAINGFDLLNNKVVNAEPVQPVQKVLLFLDETYVETERLTDEQRKTIRNRLIIYGVIFTILLSMLADSLGVVYWETWIAQAINQNLRVKMIENAEHLSLKQQSHSRTGDVIYRVFQDSRMVSNVIASVILDPLEQGVAMFGAMLIVFLFSPLLGVMLVGAAIPIFLLAWWWTPRIQRRAWLSRQSNSNLTSRIQEVSQSLRVIKANQAEEISVRRFDRDSNYALDNAFLLRVEILCFYIAMASIVGVALIVGDYLMASWTIVSAETFAGAAFVALVGFAIWNLGAFETARQNNADFLGKYSFLFVRWFSTLDLTTGLNRAYYLLDLQPEVTEIPNAQAMPSPVDTVQFENMQFGYEDERLVLRDINLTAQKGTITAIVGQTGSGKSTLMSMLLRLYDPHNGHVMINGVDLRHLTIQSIRKNVAIALQQNVLFAATIAENIGYAADRASRDDIQRAAEVACADAFIQEMANGYDTELGERGGKLSTGQRQRLSIARAIVRDTPILILDEPTASLDAETELEVLENLSEWGRDRILFLITHRISTIRNADQIAFLKDGTITEIGNYGELVSRPNGDFRRFVSEETTASSDIA